MGLFVIISSPTGGGKDTVISELLKIIPNCTRLITTTSRAPRPTDTDGVSYHFISRQEFEDRIKQGYFLEYNNFADNYYGTPKAHLTDLLSTYNCVLSNLDVHGKKSMDKLGVPHVSIFLMPDNLEVLAKRARDRGGITEEMIAKRIAIAKEEIAQVPQYDYAVTNVDGKLQETVQTVADIIRQNLASSR